jgi:hypothetical protein
VADEVAHTLRLFARILTATLLVLGIVTTLLMRVGNVRKVLAVAGDTQVAGNTFAGVIYTVATVAMVLSFGALLTGYVSLARFINY